MTSQETAKTKRVTFDSEISTVVAYIETGSELLEEDVVWFFTEEERTHFKKEASKYTKALQEKYPSLAKGMECIYLWADAKAHEEKSNKTDDDDWKDLKHPFLAKWASLTSDRRGLEKKVVSKEFQKKRVKRVQASRTVVFTLQGMYAKTTAANKEDVIRRQYEDFSRPASILAHSFGLNDEAIAKGYYFSSEFSSKSSDHRRMGLSKLGDSMHSLGSGGSDHSLKFGDSFPSLKTKETDNNDELKSSSNHSKSSRPSKSKRSISAKKKKTRSHSPKKTPSDKKLDRLEGLQRASLTAPAC